METQRTTSSLILWSFVTALLYAGAGRLAMLLAIPPGYATPVFPSAGIALAIVVVLGARMAPAVLAGSFLLNLWLALAPVHGAPPPLTIVGLVVAGCIAIGATLQALLGAHLVRRLLGSRLALSSELDIVKFLVAAGPVACLVNAILGPLVLVMCGVMPSAAFLANMLTWWVGDALGVIVFAPAVLVLLGEPRELWRRRRLSVGVPLVASFALVTAAFVHLRGAQSEAAVLDFRGHAEDAVDAIYKTFEGYRDAVMSVERHFVVSETVTSRDFARLVERTLARNSDLNALSYAPRVATDALSTFAAKVSEERGTPYATFETDAFGGRLPSRPRPAHFPVQFIEPLESNASALGFDLASEPMRAAAINAAIALRDTRATLVPHLVQDPMRRPALFVVEPVLGPDGTARGLACAAFRIDAMLASAAAASHLEGGRLALFAGDTGAGALPLVAYDIKTHAIVAGLAEAAGGERYDASIAFGGQALRFAFQVDTVPLPASASSSVWTFMVLGLLLTAMLTAFLLAITGRTDATERLIAERTAALEASRTRFRAVTESAYDAIIVADENGDIASWNAAAERIFGHTSAEAIGRSLGIIVPERFRVEHANGLMLAAKGRSGQLVGRTQELRGQHASGRELDVEQSLTHWDAGDGLYFTAVVRDISQRKAADAAAAETRHVLETFYDAIPSMMGVVDVDGDDVRHVAVNRALAAYFGRGKNDVEGATNAVAQAPEEMRSEWLKHFAAATAVDVPYTFELIRDGGAKVFSATLCRLGPAPQGGVRFCFSAVDLSAQKHAERALHVANQSLEARVEARTSELGYALGRLRESEMRFRQLADSMPHIVWTARPDGTTDYFNQRWYEFLGLSANEAQGIGLAPQMPAEDAAAFEAQWADAVGTGEEFATEYRLLDRSTGEHRWHLGRVLPLRDDTGSVSRWIGTSTDIHEQKEVLRVHLEGQKKLAQSEANFRFLAETIPQLVWVADGQGAIEFFNRRWVEYTGCTLEESRNSESLLLPEDRILVSMAWSRSISGRVPFDMEYRLRRHDGTYRWQLARAMPLEGDLGVTRWFGTATDIHDQKVKEQELKGAQMALELAQETAQVASWEYDVRRGVLTRTQMHDRFYGYDAMVEPWTADSVLDRVHPDDRARVAAAIEASHDGTGDGYAMEYRVVWPNESVHWLSFMARFIRDDRGVVTHHRGTVFDVTALHAMKERQQQLAVREQTAVESSRLKSEFLASMSHEIRTPINGVLGMTRMLLDTPLTAEQRDFGDAIKRSGDALLTVINDILDFSKIEAGKLDFEQIDFQLAQTVEDARSTIAYAAQKRGLTFISELAGNLPESVKGDPGRLRQVVTNLLSNAVKFTQQGSVTLRAFAVSSTPTEHVVRFEIKDTGIGVPRAAGERLFKAFTQADNSTTRRFGGTGLGLSICKALVERMEGEIGFESEEGRGSTFWFTVRLLRSTQKAEPAAAPVMTATTTGRKARILVAEDIQINQIIAIKMLERLGYAAHAVANGREALHALHSSSYDLVLMDCHMPEMDGYEATVAVRASKSLPNPRVPIIAMTANAMRGDREKCLSVGMSDYVAKPVEPSSLAAVLRKWLEVASEAAPDKSDGGDGCDPSTTAA